MKPVVLTVSIPATVLSCQVNADEEVAEGPSADVPELKELNHYIGQWEDEISGRPDMKRTELAEWILGGRFLRQAWSTEAGDGTLHAGDDRMRHPMDQLDCGVQAPDQALKMRPPYVRCFVDILRECSDVAACHEMRTCAAQHDHAQ